MLYILLAFSGCSGDKTGDGDEGSSETASVTEETNSKQNNDGLSLGASGLSSPYTSLRIDAENSELMSVNGQPVTLDLNIIGIASDGSEQQAENLEFEIDNRLLGSFDPDTGVFTSNGRVGGSGVITVRLTDFPDIFATFPIEVNLESENLAEGLESSTPELFAEPITEDERAAVLVYPLDGAVMPQNVYPADLQWTGGVAGDIFKVTLEKTHIAITQYLLHTGAEFKNHWLVDEDSWRSLAQTDVDEKARLRVERWDASTEEALAPADEIKIKFAEAALTGSIYYWDIEDARIKRIDDGVGEAVTFMPTPPAGRGGSNCVGCHSVSNSGRYMAGRLAGGNNVGTIFDLTKDLTGDPAESLWDPIEKNLEWFDSTWNPDDTRLMISYQSGDRQLKLYDPFLAEEVEVTGSLPKGIQPAWDSFNELVAFVANANASSTSLTDGDIATIDVIGEDTFGEHRVIHVGSDLAESPEKGTADSYPSWSPNSARIAFAHGTGARSDWPDQKFSGLYIMTPDGENVVRLDKANGEEFGNFQPNFSPFYEGGYYWLTFLSRRDYGNAEQGTSGTKRQQIWVTGIKANVDSSQDPSQVSYWLPGQSTGSKNISAFWAPRACRQDGEDCSVSSECCGGDCRENTDGALECSPPPPERCRRLSETCSTSEDCCEGVCNNNVCIVSGPR